MRWVTGYGGAAQSEPRAAETVGLTPMGGVDVFVPFPTSVQS